MTRCVASSAISLHGQRVGPAQQRLVGRGQCVPTTNAPSASRRCWTPATRQKVADRNLSALGLAGRKRPIRILQSCTCLGCRLWDQKAMAGTSGGTWEERVDPSSGKTFYFNPVERRSSWTLPEGASVAPSRAAPTTAASGSSSKQGMVESSVSLVGASDSRASAGVAAQRPNGGPDSGF